MLSGNNRPNSPSGGSLRDFQQVDIFLQIYQSKFTILKIIHNDESDVFNIGNDNEITINYLAEKIIELTNSKSEIVFLELPENDPKQRKPDLTKARKLLSYEPKISLDEGLKLTIDWISKNYK